MGVWRGRRRLADTGALEVKAPARGRGPWAADSSRWAARLSALVGGREAIIDTSRNGLDAPPDGPARPATRSPTAPRRRRRLSANPHLLAGADVVMTTSALLRHGPEHATVLDALTTWMRRKGPATVDDLRGLPRVPPDQDQTGYERCSYVNAIGQATHTYAPVRDRATLCVNPAIRPRPRPRTAVL